MKTYYYTNDLGIGKKLEVATEAKDGKYSFWIWNQRNGEECGSGKMTEEKLKDFLAYYKAKLEG